MTLFKRLTKMKRDGKLDEQLISGYIRIAQKEYKHLNIPTALWNLVCLFGIEYDRFAECGFSLQKNESNDIFKNVTGRGGTCYGELYIRNDSYSAAFIYQWKFKIIRYVPANLGSLEIGIVDAKCNYLGIANYAYNSHHWHISFCNEGVIYKTKWYDPTGDNKELYMESIESEMYDNIIYGATDTITLSYSAKYKSLDLAVQDEDGHFSGGITTKVNFEQPGLQYKLAIFTDSIGAEIQMLKFEKFLLSKVPQGTLYYALE